MKKQKLFPVITLLAIQFLLIFQESILSQVLCYKDNEPTALEIAVGDFKCSCATACSNHQMPITEHETSELCSPLACTDQPVNSSWLTRIISPNSFQIKIITTPNFNYFLDTFFNSHFSLDIPTIYELLKRATKFLPEILTPTTNAPLRC